MARSKAAVGLGAFCTCLRRLSASNCCNAAFRFASTCLRSGNGTPFEVRPTPESTRVYRRLCFDLAPSSLVFRRYFGVSPSMTVGGSFGGRSRGFQGIKKLCPFFRCRSRSYFRLNSRSHSGHLLSFSIFGTVWLWAVSKCLFRTALLRKTISNTGHFKELLPKLIFACMTSVADR